MVRELFSEVKVQGKLRKSRAEEMFQYFWTNIYYKFRTAVVIVIWKLLPTTLCFFLVDRRAY